MVRHGVSEHVDSVGDHGFTGIPGSSEGSGILASPPTAVVPLLAPWAVQPASPSVQPAQSQHQAIPGDFMASSGARGWAGQTWQGLVRLLPTFNKGILYAFLPDTAPFQPAL